MNHWTVPKFWIGQTVAVLASGPNMSQAVADQVRDAGIQAIAVNNTFRLAGWASVLYAADETWWHQNPDAMQFAGLKVSVGQVRGVLMLKHSGVTGFDPDPGCLRTGGNSGFQGVHLAAHTGAARILLLGFDMKANGHWHPEHPAPLKMSTPECYQRWIPRFDTLARELKARGVDVINCTPGSALRAFPMADLTDVLEDCCESD